MLSSERIYGRFVTMYDIRDSLLNKWCSQTGCGVAVLMSREKKQAATLMTSD